MGVMEGRGMLVTSESLMVTTGGVTEGRGAATDDVVATVP